MGKIGRIEPNQLFGKSNIFFSYGIQLFPPHLFLLIKLGYLEALARLLFCWSRMSAHFGGLGGCSWIVYWYEESRAALSGWNTPEEFLSCPDTEKDSLFLLSFSVSCWGYDSDGSQAILAEGCIWNVWLEEERKRLFPCISGVWGPGLEREVSIGLLESNVFTEGQDIILGQKLAWLFLLFKKKWSHFTYR